MRPTPMPTSTLVPEVVPMTVRYEDEHLLVVDKPAGVVTHPSAGHSEGTLVHGLLAHAIAGGGDPTRPGIVHRLDRDTSGLLVVARSERRAHRRLQRILRDRLVERHYLALVHGATPPALTVDRPIGRDRRIRTRMAIDDAEGRIAVTHLRRLEDLGRFTLADVRLETGRTHQIRVHLESVGHPVVGDRVYGRREANLGLSGSSCTPPGSPSRTPRPVSRSRWRAHCRTTSSWRCGGPAGAAVPRRAAMSAVTGRSGPLRWPTAVPNRSLPGALHLMAVLGRFRAFTRSRPGIHHVRAGAPHDINRLPQGSHPCPRHHETAARVGGPFRAPDPALEPEDEALHLR